MTDLFRDGAPMVRWFQPRQLLSTAAKVIASTARTDFRAISALGEWQDPFGYDDRDEIWIDYVADVGDGWNPTYAVARAMAAPQLELELEGVDHSLASGELVIMGGDQVYPFATRDSYKQRLRLPYQAAYHGKPGMTDLFALPGNHDWYDGLVSFTRLFCHRRKLGTLQTRQTRSYFALRLPHNWWLLAFDIQLEADIDQPQITYFKKAAVSDFGEGDRVIVCTAAPGWVEDEGSPLSKNFRFIENEIQETGARIHLWLAGDLHCYMRHVEGDGELACHKVIAGGGGAFLHPTHGPGFDRTNPETRYPDVRRSRSLSWGNLLFFVNNPRFSVVLGILFAVLGVAVAPAVADIPVAIGGLGDAFTSGLGGLIASPFALLLAALLVIGGIGFAGGKSVFAWIGGVLLGVAMLAAAIVAAWLSVRAAAAWPPSTGRLLLAEAALYTGVVGGLFGLLVLGVFLTAANLAGRVLSHGFSAMRIEGFKNFVRLHITGDGSLELYAVGLDNVPRRWVRTGSGEAERIDPDGDPLAPHLIERVTVAGPVE
jgi:hypothetical protein